MKLLRKVRNNNGNIVVIEIQAKDGAVYSAFKFNGDRWCMAKYKTPSAKEGYFVKGCEDLAEWEMTLKMFEICKGDDN